MAQLSMMNLTPRPRILMSLSENVERFGKFGMNFLRSLYVVLMHFFMRFQNCIQNAEESIETAKKVHIKCIKS